MSLPMPWTFFPELSEANLRPVAEALLDVRYQTVKEMSGPLDCNFTRETAVFGRQRNLLIDMAMSRKGMSLVHPGMDVTFKIGEVPVRFFTDDPESPQKHGFFKRNQVDNLFSVDDQEPVLWRFIVEKALSEEDDDRCYFIGYNAYLEKVSSWECRSKRGGLYSAGGEVPPVVPIAPAQVSLKPRPDEGEKSGSDEQ
jgi:hypothetical protein